MFRSSNSQQTLIRGRHIPSRIKRCLTMDASLGTLLFLGRLLPSAVVFVACLSTQALPRCRGRRGGTSNMALASAAYFLTSLSILYAVIVCHVSQCLRHFPRYTVGSGSFSRQNQSENKSRDDLQWRYFLICKKKPAEKRSDLYVMACFSSSCY